MAIYALQILYGAYDSYLLRPNIYFANTSVLIMSLEPGSTLESEMKQMKSAEFLTPIIQDLSLDKIWARRVYKVHEGMTLPMADAVLYMQAMVRFTTKPGSSVIDIRAASEVPKEAADVANAIADRYIKLHTNPSGQLEASILSRAQPPDQPTLPNHFLDILWWVRFGVFIALLLSALIEVVFCYASLPPSTAAAGPTTPKPSDEY